MSDAYVEAAAAWAIAAWKGSGQKAARARADKLSARSPLAEVAERFGLDDDERLLVELAWAVERSVEAARAAGSFTVERAREAVGAAADEKLAPGARLRRRGLVVVEDGWLGGARAAVRLAPGLGRRLDGEEPSQAALGPGTRRIPPGADGWHDRFPATARVAELVREQLGAAPELLLIVEACGRREAIALGAAAARSFRRGVLLVDGEALAPLPGAATLLAAARRDADLDGDLLIVVQAGALGEAWRAAAPEPADGAKAATFVVLADSARVPDVVLDEGLAAHAVVWQSIVPSTAAGTVAAAAAKPKDEDGFDYIRQLAVRDAERALGVVRRAEPPASVSAGANIGNPNMANANTGHSNAANQNPANKNAGNIGNPNPPSANAGNPNTANAHTANPNTANPNTANPNTANPNTANPNAGNVNAANPENANPNTANANTAAAPAPPKVKRRSKKGMMYFGDPAASAEPEPPPAPRPLAPPPPPTVAPAAATAAVSPGLPYVDIPADAPPEYLARIAGSCPNPNQRIELLYKLGGQKSAAVVAVVRANAKSEHAGVRAAAEAVMASLFGPEWNRTRPVPKPVQRAPSDDKDRGPPGGF